MLAGVLLPYRCPGCDRRFLGFPGSATAEGSLDAISDRPGSPKPAAIRQFFLFRKGRRRSVGNKDASKPATPQTSQDSFARFDALDLNTHVEEDTAWTAGTSGVPSRDYRFRVVTPNPAQRRREQRRKSDPQVIQLQTRIGEPECLTSTLLDASAGGIGISTSTPLTVGLTIAARGQFDDSRSERVSFATVKWCAKTMNGHFQAGLEFGDRHSTTENEPQRFNAQTREEFDYYELLQLSPNAEPETIARVYRLLARRFHPHKRETGDLEMFLKLHRAYMVLGDPELRAEYDSAVANRNRCRGKLQTG